ncbi:hypothetical protein BBJ28_00011461, partial [Nothophytophthora sp. Chile5]
NANVAVIVRKEAIWLLMALVKAGTNDQKGWAALALGNIAVNEANRVEVVRDGGISPLVVLVRAGTDEQKLYAALALGNIACNNDANCMEIARDGGISPLVTLVRAGTDEQKQWAAYALGNIAVNEANCVEVAREGGISPLVVLVRAGTDEQKQYAAYALGIIACDNDANCVEIARDGGVSPLVALVRAGTDEQKLYAALALGNLAVNKANRVEIARDGGISPLVALVKAGTDDQKQWAALALGNIAVNEASRVEVARDGGISPLLVLERSGTDEQKQNAAFALTNLAMNDANRRGDRGESVPDESAQKQELATAITELPLEEKAAKEPKLNQSTGARRNQGRKRLDPSGKPAPPPADRDEAPSVDTDSDGEAIPIAKKTAGGDTNWTTPRWPDYIFRQRKSKNAEMIQKMIAGRTHVANSVAPVTRKAHKLYAALDVWRKIVGDMMEGEEGQSDATFIADETDRGGSDALTVMDPSEIIDALDVMTATRNDESATQPPTQPAVILEETLEGRPIDAADLAVSMLSQISLDAIDLSEGCQAILNGTEPSNTGAMSPGLGDQMWNGLLAADVIVKFEGSCMAPRYNIKSVTETIRFDEMAGYIAGDRWLNDAIMSYAIHAICSKSAELYVLSSLVRDIKFPSPPDMSIGDVKFVILPVNIRRIH